MTENSHTVTYSLFNAADDLLADLIGLGTFEESLLMNVLFQDKILVHESVLFNSTLLARHLGGSPDKESLFEHAARKGFVTPAYRNRGCERLEDAYQAMLRPGVYGPTYRLQHPDMAPFKFRVEAAIDAGVKKEKPFYWPETRSLSAGYLATLRQMLQRDAPSDAAEFHPDRQAHLKFIWQDTRRWRYDLIEEAARRTAARDPGGVQRTEIVRLLGASVGIPYGEASAPSTAELVDRAGGEQEKLAMSVFIKWISQCHHLNQAQLFGTAMNFPAYHVDQDFLMDSLLRTPLDAAPAPGLGFRCDAWLPPIAQLLSIDVDRLIGLREDLGGPYLKALDEWNRNPSEDRAASVNTQLKDYCRKISVNYEEKHLDPIVARFSVGLGQGMPAVVLGAAIKGFGDEAKTLAGQFMHNVDMLKHVPMGVFATVVAGAVATVKFVKHKKARAALSPVQRELEVTVAYGESS